MTLKLIAAGLLVALLISMWIINYLLMLIREGSLLDRPASKRDTLQHEGIGSINRIERVDPSIHMGRGVLAGDRKWSFEDTKKKAIRRASKKQAMLRAQGIPSASPETDDCKRSPTASTDIKQGSMNLAGGGVALTALPKCPVCGQSNELESVELDAVEMPDRVSGSRRLGMVDRRQSHHDLIDTSK